MKNISLLFCSILIPIFTFSQWTLQSPLPQGNYLSSIRFTNANTGYAAGGGGMILKTINAGATWTVLPSGTTLDLTSIFFVDANIGYAVGDSGTILKTLNAGATWTALSSGTTDGLRSVYFTSANTGYAVGGAYISTTWSYTQGVLLKTINGGATWTATTNSLSWIVNSVFFTDANTGYAVGSASTFFGGSGYMLKTIDGGTTWTESWGYGIPKSIYFTDANTGYTLGGIEQQYSGPIGGYIDKTIDGGATWNQVWYQDGIYPASVCFTNATTGYAVGRSEDGWFMPTINGVILKTINGGNTWTTIFFGSNQGFSSVAFTDANNGYVAGGGIYPLDGISYPMDGSIFKTGNMGSTWTYLLNGSIYNLNSVCFNDVNTGFTVGDGGSIVKTTTGGTTWSSMSSGTAKNLISVDFTSANIGYVAGEAGTVLKTINGGTSWTPLSSATSNDLMKIYFTSTSTGFIAGNNGTLKKTTNAGALWSTLFSGTTNNLSDMYFTSTTTGYAVGDSGTIIKTTNGGTNWSALASGTTKSLESVFFISASAGYAVGDNGTILKTVNSGTSWIAMPSGTTCVLTEIFFSNLNIGYAVGDSGAIIKTINSGATWTTMLSESDDSLTSIYFADATTGYSVGKRGTILKTKTIPIVITENATLITNNSATSGGNIVSEGFAPVTDRGVCWSTAPSPTTADSATSNGSGTGVFTSVLNNLTPETQYFYRAYAVNSFGTAYGNELSFTTEAFPTTLAVTGNVTGIKCYSATQTILVAGNGTTFTVNNGGSATMIAGQSIRYLPGTAVNEGGYMNGYITSDGSYCILQKSPKVNETAVYLSDNPSDGKDISLFKVYPNPTTGSIFIEINNHEILLPKVVKVYSIFGKIIFDKQFELAHKYEISLTGWPSGVYILKVTQGGKTEIRKIMKVD